MGAGRTYGRAISSWDRNLTGTREVTVPLLFWSLTFFWVITTCFHPKQCFKRQKTHLCPSSFHHYLPDRCVFQELFQACKTVGGSEHRTTQNHLIHSFISSISLVPHRKIKKEVLSSFFSEMIPFSYQ